jgi:glycosyltransferase involved in cell wall biosynthesis
MIERSMGDIENSEVRTLRILLLGTQMATGGAQKVLLDQARWFHQRGHKVFAVFFYDKEGLQPKWQAASDFPLIDLKAFQKGRAWIVNGIFLVRGLFSLWRLLRREKIDVIEAFTHDSNMLALPIAWLARVPVRIATHHGAVDGLSPWRGKIHSWMINKNIANLLVTVSEGTRQNALEEGVHPHRISVIQNGIAPFSIGGADRSRACTERSRSVRRAAGVGEEDIFLLSVGRLVYQKAHEVLLAAMPAVLKEFPNARLGICGDGILYPQLGEQIESLGLAKSVKLLGRFDSVAKFLAAADVFILPSRWEGLPIALLEAMSAGLPIVATRVEGVDEVVHDGEHGLLVPVEDADALAGAILQLAGDPEMRQKMGAAARRRIEQTYTVDRMCERYLDVMMSLLQKNKGKRDQIPNDL